MTFTMVALCFIGLFGLAGTSLVSALPKPFVEPRDQAEFGTCVYRDQNGDGTTECIGYYHVGGPNTGTSTVTCYQDGKCYVGSCKEGWAPDANKRNCVGPSPENALNYCNNGKVYSNTGCVCPSNMKLTQDGSGCAAQGNSNNDGYSGTGFCQRPPCS